MRVRIARDELRRLREPTQAINALEAEIAELAAHVAPQLLTEPGFGRLTAAKLVAEITGADRWSVLAAVSSCGTGCSVSSYLIGLSCWRSSWVTLMPSVGWVM
jgi:transposase